MATLKVKAAAGTNSVLASAGKRKLECIILSNTTAATKYIKFYDKATAPVVGTDVPMFTLAIPASGILNLRKLSIWTLLGLGFAITGAVAEADVTAVVADDVVGFIQFQ